MRNPLKQPIKQLIWHGIPSLSLLLASTAPACPTGSLCKGDRIMDRNHLVGTVLSVSEKGQVQIQMDHEDRERTRSINDLAKGVLCLESFCAGDRVMVGREFVGSILEIFENRRAIVLLDGERRQTVRRDLDQLARGFRCIEDICAQQKITDKMRHSATLLEVFDNGFASVHLDQFSSVAIRSFSSLGIRLDCQSSDSCAWSH